MSANLSGSSQIKVIVRNVPDIEAFISNNAIITGSNTTLANSDGIKILISEEPDIQVLFNPSVQYPFGGISTLSASHAETSSYAFTASYINNTSLVNSSSHAEQSDNAMTSSYASTVDWVYITNLPQGIVSSSNQINTGSYSGSITQALTASISETSSYSNAVEWLSIINLPIGIVTQSIQIDVRNTTGIGTIATTGSNIFNGIEIITGSINSTGSNNHIGNITITGSNKSTGSVIIVGNQIVTGSLFTSGTNSLIGNTTITGTIFISGNISASDSLTVADSIFGAMTGTVSASYIDVAVDGTPSWKEGRMFYNNTDHALTYYNEASDVSVQIGQETLVRVRNATGTTISNGSAVKIVGAQGNRPKIDLSIAQPYNTGSNGHQIILGVTTMDISSPSDGYVTVRGVVHGIDLSQFGEGDNLYLSTTTSGSYTNARPSTDYDVVKVGTVLVASNNGQLYVDPKAPTHLHDITGIIISGTVRDGDSLVYESSSGMWKNSNIWSGSIYGTSSWATNAQTASYAINIPVLTWSNITNVPVGIVSSSDQVNTGSLYGTSSYAISASWAPGAFDATVNRGYSGSFTGSLYGDLTSSNAASINGLTVGRGGFSGSNKVGNIAVGEGALDYCDFANEVIAIGNNALQNNKGANGTACIAIGHNALGGNFTAGNRNQNIAIGFNSMANVGNGDNYGNLSIGYYTNLNGGLYNVALGNGALSQNYGSSNVAVGASSLAYNRGNGNTAVGTYSQGSAQYVSGGAVVPDYNTSIGYQSLYQNLAGDLNISIGSFAGWWETGSEAFYVGNRQCNDLYSSQTASLMYGTMDVSVSLQRLRINANVGIGGSATATSPLNIKSLPTSSVGLSSGDIWNNGGVLNVV